jgi:methylenetetrahydrofolate reductase (NADPH)
MADEVPGVVIPPAMVKQMTDAPDKESQQETGAAVAVEILEKLRDTPGIRGVHIMAVHWESIIPRLVEEAGLPRPAITALAEEPALES